MNTGGKHHETVLLAGLLVLLCASPAAALEIAGVQMPETLNVQGRELHLNGAGLRTRFFFKIYAGGLYLERPGHDAAEIIEADAPMLVRMHFIYDGIGSEQMQEGWKEGFAVTVPHPSAGMKAAIGAFVRLFTKNLRTDDVYDIAWLPGRGVEVRCNGTTLGTVGGPEFKKALFAIWLGRRPVDSDLKEGMLGR